MRKMSIYYLMSLMVGLLSVSLEGASNSSTSTQTAPKKAASYAHEEDDEYDIMDRDEIDDTDIFAIPLDDSEVEDEEEINAAEKKEVFHLPHAR